MVLYWVLYCSCYHEWAVVLSWWGHTSRGIRRHHDYHLRVITTCSCFICVLVGISGCNQDRQRVAAVMKAIPKGLGMR